MSDNIFLNKPLSELVGLITTTEDVEDERMYMNIRGLERFLFDNPQSELIPASIKHHHAEKGGYARHISEVMQYCYNMFSEIIPASERNFALSSLLLAAFIHDLDKVFRYQVDSESPTEKQLSYASSLGVEILDIDSKASISTKIDNKKNNKNDPIQYYTYADNPFPAEETAMVLQICMGYDIVLTKEEVHAIAMHHGGWALLAKQGNSNMTNMATTLHCSDLMSARFNAKVTEPESNAF